MTLWVIWVICIKVNLEIPPKTYSMIVFSIKKNKQNRRTYGDMTVVKILSIIAFVHVHVPFNKLKLKFIYIGKKKDDAIDTHLYICLTIETRDQSNC